MVILPHGGHSASGLTNAGCVQQLMAAFLDTTDPNALDWACLAGIKRPAFAVSNTSVGSPASVPRAQQQERKEITVPEEILEAYVGDYGDAFDVIVITLENGAVSGVSALVSGSARCSRKPRRSSFSRARAPN